MTVYTEGGGRPGISSGKILQDGELPTLLLSMFTKMGRFQNSILSQEGNLRQRTYLNNIINFLMIHHSKWPDLLSSSVCPRLHSVS